MPNRATKPATPAAVAGLERSGDRDGALTVRSDAPGRGSEERRHLPAGTVVGDRYRVASVLGEGGMGLVYAAEHVHMRKEVALKVLHAEMCTEPEMVARFEREAIAAAHIDHPNVAAATDFGRLPDGSCFLVLELVRGRSLRDELARGPLPLGRALRVLRGISEGVSAAHAKGIIHRDLKPENVMLVERAGGDDFVKVLDFGIAKVDTSVAAAPRAGAGAILTQMGSVFGTPEYMAPEQAVGDVVDARADLYALGVVLLEMITGKCPFEGKPLSLLRERILSAGPPDLAGVAEPSVRALLEKLLARDVAHRMQTAAELVAALDTILAETEGGAAAPPPSPALLATPPPVAAEPLGPAARASSRTPWWLAAAAVAVVIGAAGFALVRAAEAPPAEREALEEGAPPPAAAAAAPRGRDDAPLDAALAPAAPSEPAEAALELDLVPEPAEAPVEIDPASAAPADAGPAPAAKGRPKSAGRKPKKGGAAGARANKKRP